LLAVPGKIKSDEYRVAMLPSGVEVLTSAGHRLLIERGAGAPQLVTADDLKFMKPGAVVIDVCIDQGGCLETSRPTTHSNPTYIVDGILHYCVTNMPGAVRRTSTYALCNVTFSYVLRIANTGLQAACQKDAGLAAALNIANGRVTNQAVAETFQLPYVTYDGRTVT